MYQLLLKTHKLTIFVTASPTKTIASLKDEALSALVSDINQAEHVPKITQEGEFEICRAIKERGKSTGEYEILDPSKQVKELGISGWEHLYFQFRDPSGESCSHLITLHLVTMRATSTNDNLILALRYSLSNRLSRRPASRDLHATQHRRRRRDGATT